LFRAAESNPARTASIQLSRGDPIEYDPCGIGPAGSPSCPACTLCIAGLFLYPPITRIAVRGGIVGVSVRINVKHQTRRLIIVPTQSEGSMNMIGLLLT